MKKPNFNSSKLLVNTLIGASFLLGGLIWQNPASAQFRLAPMYIQMKSEKSKSTGVINIENTGNKPLVVRLSATAFTYDKNGDFQRLPKGVEKDLTPYLQYSPREMTIPPNATRNVRLVSILPPSLPDGEYRVAVFAETLQESSNPEGFKVAVKANIGSAIYVIKGNLSPDLSIQAATFQAKDKHLNLLVRNQGTATARPTITWRLMQDKTEVAQGRSGASFLPKSEVNVLLNTQQQINSNIAPGRYKLVGEIEWQQQQQQKVMPFEINVSI